MLSETITARDYQWNPALKPPRFASWENAVQYAERRGFVLVPPDFIVGGEAAADEQPSVFALGADGILSSHVPAAALPASAVSFPLFFLRSTTLTGHPLQRIEQTGENDSLRCCIAMVLGMHYKAVPDFSLDDLAALRRWLARRNLDLLVLGPPWALLDEIPEAYRVIKVGPRDLDDNAVHAVVDVGGVVFDPHHAQLGLKNVRRRLLISKR